MKPNLDAFFHPKKFKAFFKAPFSRRHFLKLLGLFSLTALFTTKTTTKLMARNSKAVGPRPGKKIATAVPLAVVQGKNPAANTRKAVELLGGMDKFVHSGDTVVIKPNIGWNRAPQYAANTNPLVLATLVTMAKDAGAKRVRVFDNTCNDARMCYDNSGIQEAVKKSGGMIYHVRDIKWRPGRFPAGAAMKDWLMYQDAVECDTFINVPVAKHHGLSKLSLSIKNLMGVCGGRRGAMHWNLDEKLAEVLGFIRPELTVVDATRILLRHGPTGGNLEDVEHRDTIIASHDPVLADAYATTLFGLKPGDIGYIVASAKAGLGSMDIQQPGIRTTKA